MIMAVYSGHKMISGNKRTRNEYWGDLLYRSVIDDSRIIINLASKEYSKCIEKYLTPQDRYITNHGSKVLYM